jgi:hypothetical protein
MTLEQRLDRLERIAELFVKAGLRARRVAREQSEKIDMLIDLQIHNEERFAKQDEKIDILFDLHIQNEERFGRNEERFARNEERFATLAEAQAQTDRRLEALIDIVREGRNGGH